MTNNNPENVSLRHIDPLDRDVVQMTQIRLIGLYERKYRHNGGWRALADKLKLLNVAYLYDFVMHGKIPNNPDTRRKLGLPRVMISERKPKVKREPAPKVWEKPELYLRKVKR